MALSLRFLQAQPDGRLTQLAREGHEPAFEALVRRYRNELLSYCRRLTFDAGNAEDTLQQALLQAWRALNAGAEVRDIKPWLYRIAHNVAVSQLRAAGALSPNVEEAAGSFDVDQVVQQRLQARAALASMASLPELQRQVFVRATLDGASHEEVATALGLTNGAVRGLIYRARAALRAAAAAVVPTPVLSWAFRHVATRSKRAHMVEAAVGGGGAGMAGLIAKGGALIAITGAVAGGGMIVAHTTPHRHQGEASRGDVHRADGPSISATRLAHRAQAAAPGSRSSNANASAPGAGESNDMRGGSSGSAGSSSGPSASGHDGGSSGGSAGGSSGGSDGGSRGGSSGGSDGDSSFATSASRGTSGGGSGDSKGSSGSGSSDGGSSGSSGSDGGTSGTSGGQVTTATTTSGGISGTGGGSSGSSGPGGTTTTTGLH